MPAVAIDGPAGAGKSTVARAVAAALGFTYVDTGAMYRAVALTALERGIDPDDAASVTEVAGSVEISLRDEQVFVDGRDVTGSLRTPDVTRASALVARHAGVRNALVEIQRKAAIEGHVVMEGRDIGSVVLPDAEVKIFLTASLEERTARRARDLGLDVAELDEVKASIALRDESDASRTESPLVQVADAVAVDTTGKSIEDVVAEVVALARDRLR